MIGCRCVFGGGVAAAWRLRRLAPMCGVRRGRLSLRGAVALSTVAALLLLSRWLLCSLPMFRLLGWTGVVVREALRQWYPL